MRDLPSVDARGHFQLRLPWHRDLCQITDFKFMADCRPALLRRRFRRDSLIKPSYTQVIEDGIRPEPAEPAPFAGVPDRTWYLPHHDVSLNDHLLQGPDFVNDFVGVLICLR